MTSDTERGWFAHVSAAIPARVCIGVHVHAEPDQLRRTLASLKACTSARADLLLLADGPDDETAAALAAMEDVEQSRTAAPKGAAACFNRLAAATSAAVLVLIESGTRVGPGWLSYLLAALDADPRNGLAGPSTNRCWNEQAIFPACSGTEADIAQTARRAARRFGSTTRPLVPLPHVADFCYVVRSDVVDAIGAADEGYGVGPRWETDYNHRAARAGFRAVWARSAFVYRAPAAARRAPAHALRLEAAEERYPENRASLGPSTLALPPADARPRPLEEREPLVSCIMPTRNRAEFVLQAIRYFERQDYEPRELVIVDDGDDDLAARLPADSRIRYVRSPTRESVGAKRNRACAVARGDVIAHWDDDDWYGDDRLSRQVAPIRAGDADMTALYDPVFFDLERWEFWVCEPDLHRRLFVEDVHGGTLVYERRVWEQAATYPDRSLAEDAAFLSRALRRGCRLQRLASDGTFLYLRHQGNSWRLVCGEHLDRKGWKRASAPALAREDRAFYASLRMRDGGSRRGRTRPPGRWPLVTCIMPTADRRDYARRAIAYFLRQDYPNRELIVVDDGVDPVPDLIPADDRIRYVRLDARVPVGEKRNVACDAAEGTVIAHWDDDDWMAGHRLRYQVHELERSRADICGATRELYYDFRHDRAWLLEYPSGRRSLAGNTLCYRKAVWARRPFRPLAVGEDVRFLRSASEAHAVALRDHRFYVGIIHAANTSPKLTFRGNWRPWPVDEVHRLLGPDLAFYSSLALATTGRRRRPAAVTRGRAQARDLPPVGGEARGAKPPPRAQRR